MPTVTIVREQLMEALGQQYSDREFEDLCFEFGVELDDITSEGVMQRKEKGDKSGDEVMEGEEIVYKIDISANRYDLLCLEGMALALNVFRGTMPVPKFCSVRPSSPEKIVVAPSTGQIRPHVVACVLRGVNFDQARYNRLHIHQQTCILLHPSCTWRMKISQ
jgi:phenylalanyl-tRNA synthetase beta chain